MMPVLTPRQALERLIDNDARNIREVLGREVATHLACTTVIADCGCRWLEACAVDRELARRAEENLVEALLLWRKRGGGR